MTQVLQLLNGTQPLHREVDEELEKGYLDTTGERERLAKISERLRSMDPLIVTSVAAGSEHFEKMRAALAADKQNPVIILDSLGGLDKVKDEIPLAEAIKRFESPLIDFHDDGPNEHGNRAQRRAYKAEQRRAAKRRRK